MQKLKMVQGIQPPKGLAKTEAEPPPQLSNEPQSPNPSSETESKTTISDVAINEKQENGGEAQVVPGELHSTFGSTQKKLIILTASTIAFFSPLSSNVYLPALTVLARDLSVTNADINLTVTTYLIFQGLSPMIIAGFSDDAGRRPAYIICFVLYIGANIGLALQNSYAALMVLRCIQSAGASATSALCQGIVADVATSAERGSFVAYASISTVLGPTLSPVMGGLLSQYLGWRAIFWFLVILAVPVFVGMLLFMPETCRRIVWNGSIPPQRLVNHSLVSWLEARRNPPPQGSILPERRPMRFPNPLRTLMVLTNKEAPLLMLYIGLVVGVHYLILTGIPSEFERVYGFNQIQTALVYLPYGFGGVLSSFTTGRLVDWNYRRHAVRLDFPLLKTRQLDLSHFPIERARIEIALPLLYWGSAMMVVYGWLLHLQLHVAGPLVVLFFVGWSIFAIFQVTSILVVDIYPDKPATAAAANNLIRCLFSAGASAISRPLLDAVGTGWAYTLTAFIFTGLSPTLFLLMRSGPAWRRETKAKKDKKGHS